jgi:bifunctional non-homologous end joining protein LigD
MLFQRLRKRLADDRASFTEPCLPSPAPKPPAGPDWIHEIKHDGYRLIARRDPVGIRLITRRGNDWTIRYPLVVEAVNHLKVRSCLIDGEVVCCDEKGVAAFQLLRHRRNEPKAFLYAFDLLELDGGTCGGSRSRCARQPWPAILRTSRPGLGLNEHMEHPEGTVVFQHACKMGLVVGNKKSPEREAGASDEVVGRRAFSQLGSARSSRTSPCVSRGLDPLGPILRLWGLKLRSVHPSPDGIVSKETGSPSTRTTSASPPCAWARRGFRSAAQRNG